MANLRTFLAVGCFLILQTPGRGEETNDPSSAIEVFVDQSTVPLVGPKVTVPFDAKQIRFFVSPPPGQVRYLLKGLDREWNQRLGEVYFVVRFLSATGDQISRETFLENGRSPGWNDSLEQSQFTQRSERIVVPANADHFSVGMSSAGPSSVIGISAVTDISVIAIGKDNAGTRILMQNSEPVDAVGDPTAFRWQPAGTRPSMASTFNLQKGSDQSPVYVITDNDIKGHADWDTTGQKLPKVTPGELIEIKWKEVHSMGMGDPLWANYGTLQPGNYQLLVEQVGISGTPLKKTYSIFVKVPLPLWKNPFFWIGTAFALVVVASLIVRHLIRKKFQLHVQQTQLIAEERLRIARDLHDDLGTRLSHISLLGSYAESTISDVSDARASFHQIAGMSRELITALSQTVWMLSSKNDKLDALIDFLCRLVSELCRPSDIRCRIDALPLNHNVPITSEVRHNLSLAFKEAVNNSLKHSAASEIQIKIRFEESILKVTISDDGIGLTQEQRSNGNGLDNIKQRMAAVHGLCSITEPEQGGVRVCLEVPIV